MAKDEDSPSPERSIATRIARLGRAQDITGPFVNPPVIHASTVLFDSVDDLLLRRQRYIYGRRGTPTSEALESAVSALEGAEGTCLFPSGLAAASTALLACLSSGDHVLIVDTVYGPVHHFAETILKRMGIAVTYYNPALNAGVADLFRPETRAVYVEAPGSLTFEMQDLPAIAEIAHARGALVLFDNTWATPIFFRPLEHGADFSISASTKYLAGHSDVVVGTVAASGAPFKALRDTHGAMGLHVGPDDMYLTLRGLRTLAVRLERHQQSAAIVTAWLQSRPEVARVLYPALPSDPGHAIWKRDMTGATGLFGVVLNGWGEKEAKSFIDGLDLFGIGVSWGGYESLAILAKPETARKATQWPAEGPLIRLHIGLEDPADLIADLDAGFARVAGG